MSPPFEGCYLFPRSKHEGLIVAHIVGHTEYEYCQIGPGRPGPDTAYQRVETTRYQVRFEEDAQAVSRATQCDGLFH